VLIIVAVVLAFCCCGGLVGGFFIKKASESIGPARGAAGDLIGDLEAGNASGAYDRLCGDTQSRFSREQFAQGLATRPKTTDHEIVGIHVLDQNGASTATVTARLTDSSGFQDSHVFSLVKEDGDWKVCGDPY
jgi:hypothetical protein